MNFPGNTEALDWSNQPASHDSAPWANKRKAASDNRVIKVIKTDNTKPVPPTVGNNGHQFKNQSTPMNRVENLWDLKPFGRTDSGRNKATTSSSKVVFSDVPKFSFSTVNKFKYCMSNNLVCGPKMIACLSLCSQK